MAFSRLEQALMLVVGIDIATPGFSRAAAKAAVAALARVTPPLAAGVAGTAATFPITTGAALGGAALATPPGQDLLAAAAERGRMDRIRFEQALTDLTRVAIPKAKARTKSKFNKMVSTGMKAIKASTSYGKKGAISNTKKAFSVATKAASAVIKGHKLPKPGIKRRIMTMMRKMK
jgi:hypothetical protein